MRAFGIMKPSTGKIGHAGQEKGTWRTGDGPEKSHGVLRSPTEVAEAPLKALTNYRRCLSLHQCDSIIGQKWFRSFVIQQFACPSRDSRLKLVGWPHAISCNVITRVRNNSEPKPLSRFEPGPPWRRERLAKVACDSEQRVLASLRSWFIDVAKALSTRQNRTTAREEATNPRTAMIVWKQARLESGNPLLELVADDNSQSKNG